MIYLIPSDNTFGIYFDYDSIPNKLKPTSIEVESLPEGDGIIRRRPDGSFYREPYKEPMTDLDPQPTLDEMQTQTLLNTEYLVIMSELTNL